VLGLEVMLDRDVRAPTLGTGLVDPDVANTVRIILDTGPFEHQRKATALTHPRHRQSCGLATAAALRARDLGIQPRFAVEEVEVPPAAPHAVVDPQELGPTRRRRPARAAAGQVKW